MTYLLLASDGPFAETKEQIAGLNPLTCASLADAIQIASRHPTTRTGILELRPFASPIDPVHLISMVDSGYAVDPVHYRTHNPPRSPNQPR